jgi:hypothetical protein
MGEKATRLLGATLNATAALFQNRMMSEREGGQGMQGETLVLRSSSSFCNQYAPVLRGS